MEGDKKQQAPEEDRGDHNNDRQRAVGERTLTAEILQFEPNKRKGENGGHHSGEAGLPQRT